MYWKFFGMPSYKPFVGISTNWQLQYVGHEEELITFWGQNVKLQGHSEITRSYKHFGGIFLPVSRMFGIILMKLVIITQLPEAGVTWWHFEGCGFKGGEHAGSERNCTSNNCVWWQALGAAEDESDIQAAKVARAELKAELAEFDENIPWDEREQNAKQREREEQSKVEMELAMLDKEVSAADFLW